MKLLLPTIAAICIVLVFSCSKSSTPPHTTPPVVPPPVTPPVPDIHLSKGLLAYYAFSGTANDSTSNHLDGVTNSGVAFATDEAGHANSAVSFDGATGYIFVPDVNGILSPDSVSISMLINLRDVSTRSTVINKVNFADVTGFSYGLSVSNIFVDQEFHFAANPSDADCSVGYVELPNTVLDNGQALVTNKWYHLVVSFVDSVENMYIDGTLKSTSKTNFKTMSKCPNTSLLIGGWWQSDVVSLQGSVDEIRIYNRSLTKDEIDSLAKPLK